MKENHIRRRKRECVNHAVRSLQGLSFLSLFTTSRSSSKRTVTRLKVRSERELEFSKIAKKRHLLAVAASREWVGRFFFNLCTNRVLTKNGKAKKKQEWPREKESHSSGIRQESVHDNTLRNNGVSAKNKRSREVVRFSSLSLSLCLFFFATRPRSPRVHISRRLIAADFYLLQNRAQSGARRGVRS